MDKLKRIIFWGGWYGSRNIGDRLLLISITDLLQNSIGPFHQIVFSVVSPFLINQNSC